MALISVIFSFLVDRYLGSLREFRNYRWLDNFTDRFRELIPELATRPHTAVILLLALLFVGTLLLSWIATTLWGVVGFGFALAVLLYSYGQQDLEPQIESFIDARLRGDEEAARFHLSALLQGRLPEDPRQLTRSVMETVLVELNDRLFSVIFWFVLLGPAGALAFRFSSILHHRFREESNGFGAAAARVYYYLSWAPARLTAFSYALAGSFVEAMHYRREEAHRWQDENGGILVASGLGALQYPLTQEGEPPAREREVKDLRATIELVRRTIMVWVVIIAMVTLIGTIVGMQLEQAF